MATAACQTGTARSQGVRSRPPPRSRASPSEPDGEGKRRRRWEGRALRGHEIGNTRFMVEDWRSASGADGWAKRSVCHFASAYGKVPYHRSMEMFKRLMVEVIPSSVWI
uniref:Uncharacterized protein n=1 Tax=Aegilops tauschii TaxID=37682 RepID=R7W2N6_AEGTA